MWNLRMNRLLLAAGLCSAALAFTACDKPGPAEQFGEEMDEAGEDLRAGEERLDNKVDDAVDELRE